MNQPLSNKPIAQAEAPVGKLLAAIALFMITGGGAALYIWWALDDLLAGRFVLGPALIALVLIGAFFALLALWGRFLKSHTHLGI